jgi:hypothetical protein
MHLQQPVQVDAQLDGQPREQRQRLVQQLERVPVQRGHLGVLLAALANEERHAHQEVLDDVAHVLGQHKVVCRSGGGRARRCRRACRRWRRLLAAGAGAGAGGGRRGGAVCQLGELGRRRAAAGRCCCCACRARRLGAPAASGSAACVGRAPLQRRRLGAGST